MKKKLQTTQRRMMRIITQTKRGTGKGHAASLAASVEDTADVKLHDPDSEPVDDTTEHNNQNFNEHEESSHDADSNPCFDEISEARLDNESSAQSGRLVSSKRNHVVDAQAEPDLLEAGKEDCQTPRRPLDPNLSPAGTQLDQPTDPTETTTISRSAATWLTASEDTMKCDAMESDFIK